METIFSFLFGFIENHRDLIDLIIFILMFLYYKFIIVPWGVTIKKIDKFIDSVKTRKEKIDSMEIKIAQMQENMILMKKAIDEERISMKDKELNHVEKISKIENQLTRITTLLEPLISLLRGIK